MNKLRENDGFECVYAEYKGKVMRYIHNRVSNVHDAEDLTSDVFVKVLNGLSGFDENKASISTWIYTITRNTVTDYFRTAKRFCELSEVLPGEDGEDDIDGSIPCEENLVQLADALESLSERERDIIILRYYGEKTLKEIAGMTNISYSYIKLLHAGALKKLRELIN